MGKTAMQQLIEYCDYLIDEWGVGEDGDSALKEIKAKVRDEYLEIEKKQIIDAWFDGSISVVSSSIKAKEQSEHYYTQTYK